MARFIWTPLKIARLADAKLRAKYDLIMAIEGTTGIGKSTLALQILRKLSFHKFKFKTDIIYTQEELIECMKKRWNSAFLSDEAINVAFNRDFYQENQKNILKLMNMNRDHCNLIILCVPNFEDLDVKIKALCRLRITVIERGIGILHMKNNSIYARDKWDSAHNEKIERSWLAAGVKPRYTQLSTFRGYIVFKPLPDKLDKLYNKIKTQKRSEIYSSQELAESVEFSNPHDKLLKFLLEGKIANRESFDNYCELLNLESISAIKAVKKRLSELGAKERVKDMFTEEIERKIRRIEGDRVTIEKLLRSIT